MTPYTYSLLNRSSLKLKALHNAVNITLYDLILVWFLICWGYFFTSFTNMMYYIIEDSFTIYSVLQNPLYCNDTIIKKKLVSCWEFPGDLFSYSEHATEISSPQLETTLSFAKFVHNITPWTCLTCLTRWDTTPYCELRQWTKVSPTISNWYFSTHCTSFGSLLLRAVTSHVFRVCFHF